MAEASSSADVGLKESEGIDLIYGIDEVPPLGEGLLLGFQQYLTMLGSTVAIPLILSGPLGIEFGSIAQAKLIATMFFVSGITTILQVTLGNRLPIVQGGTFSFLAPAIAIMGMAFLKNEGWMVRMQHVQGAIILGAFFEIIIGYTGLVGKLRKYLGPVTIAPTVALIGLALFKIGVPFAAKDWALGGLTVIAIIVFSQFLNRHFRVAELYPILLGIVAVWLLAVIGTVSGWYPRGHPGHVGFETLRSSPWIRVPYPFQWGMPQFGVAALVGMLAGYIASMLESIGDYFSCARLCGIPNPEDEVFNKGIGMEGIGCLIAGIIGTGNGTTSYSENIGAIGLTKVASRRVIIYGAIIMLFLGSLVKFGAVFTTLPQPIVGGMYIVVFGMIAGVGLSNLQFVDMNSMRNIFIIGLSLFMGLSMPEYFEALKNGNVDVPTWLATLDSIGQVGDQPGVIGQIIRTVGSTGMAVGGLFAFVLDNTVPGTREERGLTAWSSAEEEIA